VHIPNAGIVRIDGVHTRRVVDVQFPICFVRHGIDGSIPDVAALFQIFKRLGFFLLVDSVLLNQIAQREKILSKLRLLCSARDLGLQQPSPAT
jgi:hypothetical protein